ncbi:MAG: hypothetical protein GOVbin1630_12 [Prokaryotic dsDNA virus sp.]|nr:MAG: hypothetical protein GOVbin1630_12 [Prokaryotic dsDNA virus sp.]|tara:strand:+ start:16829 stop:17488 length:660 start_codon:yes stop_codon:yes gene_type:complete
MTNGKGLQWVTLTKLNWNTGSVGEYYGATGDVITHARLQADIDKEDVAMLMVDGFEKVHIKGLCKNLSGTTTTNNGAEIWIWGALGFGEPYSKVWNENPLFVYRIGGFNWNRANSTTLSTNTVIQGPENETLTGTPYDHRTGQFDGAGNCHDNFAAWADGKPISSDTPDGEKTTADGFTSGDGGMLNLIGVGMFQMLLFTLDKQGTTAIDMNFACARFY